MNLQNTSEGKELHAYGHILYIRGGGSLPPDSKCNMNTSVCITWYRLDDYEWFKPYGGFGTLQVLRMLEKCKNEYQFVSLIELLSAKKGEY